MSHELYGVGIGIVIGICIAVAAPATVLICACLKGNESEDTKYYSTFYKGMYRQESSLMKYSAQKADRKSADIGGVRSSHGSALFMGQGFGKLNSSTLLKNSPFLEHAIDGTIYDDKPGNIAATSHLPPADPGQLGRSRPVRKHSKELRVKRQSGGKVVLDDSDPTIYEQNPDMGLGSKAMGSPEKFEDDENKDGKKKNKKGHKRHRRKHRGDKDRKHETERRETERRETERRQSEKPSDASDYLSSYVAAENLAQAVSALEKTMAQISAAQQSARNSQISSPDTKRNYEALVSSQHISDSRRGRDDVSRQSRNLNYTPLLPILAGASVKQELSSSTRGDHLTKRGSNTQPYPQYTNMPYPSVTSGFSVQPTNYTTAQSSNYSSGSRRKRKRRSSRKRTPSNDQQSAYPLLTGISESSKERHQSSSKRRHRHHKQGSKLDDISTRQSGQSQLHRYNYPQLTNDTESRHRKRHRNQPSHSEQMYMYPSIAHGQYGSTTERIQNLTSIADKVDRYPEQSQHPTQESLDRQLGPNYTAMSATAPPIYAVGLMVPMNFDNRIRPV